jgi:hypothetical protein
MISIFKKAPTYTRYEAEARLYAYREKILVCSLAGIAETDSITVLEQSVCDESLGAAVLKHLSEFRQNSSKTMRNLQLKDWAAFHHSDAKSGKAFERELWHVDLALMNSAVLIWARPRLSIREDLSAFTTGHRYGGFTNAGQSVRRAIAAAKVLREQGLV